MYLRAVSAVTRETELRRIARQIAPNCAGARLLGRVSVEVLVEAVEEEGGELVGIVLVVAGEHRVVLRQRALEGLRRQRRDSLFAGLPERFE